jgi:hypothetical protein
MARNERVLLVASARARAALAAQRVVEAGGEAIIIASVDESRSLTGKFDRGIFAFDLRDGSGVVLAAELLIDARIGEIEFFDPADESFALDEHPNGVRSTSGTIDAEQIARNVA